MAGRCVGWKSCELENIDFNHPLRLVASDISPATSFFISLQSSILLLLATKPNPLSLGFGLDPPLRGIFDGEKPSILTVLSTKNSHTKGAPAKGQQQNRFCASKRHLQTQTVCRCLLTLFPAHIFFTKSYEHYRRMDASGFALGTQGAVVSVLEITSVPTAHCMARMAYSAASAMSVGRVALTPFR